MEPRDEVTFLLTKLNEGDRSASAALLPLVYDDLRSLARRYFSNERVDHTLQPTALVHECYLRLVGGEKSEWQSRAHFFAVAAESMRHVLIDHARRKRALKRDFGLKIELSDSSAVDPAKEVDLLALDEALRDLARLDRTQSRIVELRYFGGLTIEETALTLDVSPSTVKREWATAKIWLYRRLTER